MASHIQYTPESIQVSLNNICYKLSPMGDIKQGFLRTLTMGEETLAAEIVKQENGEFVTLPSAVQTECPVGGISGGNTNYITKIVFKHKFTQKIVFAISQVTNGSVVTNYYETDGNVYFGDVNDLDLAGDNLSYNAPVLLCHNSTESVTRIDVWDENQVKIATIWQDLRGAVVAEPTGILKDGSCDRPMQIELTELVDNFQDQNGDATGQYVLYMQWVVSEPNGTIATSSPRLASGISYSPIGLISRTPIQPPLVADSLRLTNDATWQGSNVQSYSWTIERANSGNTVEIGSVAYDRLSYSGSDSVDGSSDTYLKPQLIKANGNARVIINWTSQAPLINMGTSDPLDAVIPVPDDID